MNDEALDVFAAFDQEPEKALELLEGLGIDISGSFDEMMENVERRAFVIAKVMQADVLEDMRTELINAQANGLSLQEFKKSAREKLARRGWLGEVTQIDSKTGKEVKTEITPWRLELIYRNNIQSSLNAGRYLGQLANIGRRPYGRYNSIIDNRTSKKCNDRDGVTRRLDDPWWSFNYPQNHDHCRAGVTTMSEREFIRDGGVLTPDEELDKLEPLGDRFNQSPDKVFIQIGRAHV